MKSLSDSNGARPMSILLAAILMAGALIATGVPVQAQDEPPVSVSIEFLNDAVPGGVLRARANVEINDGSNIRSFAWSQTEGLDATVRQGATRNPRFILKNRRAYRDHLIHVLSEPPVSADQLPPNVPLPDGEFPAGLPNRFQVVGMNPFAIEDAGHLAVRVMVTTSSGVYHAEAALEVELPWYPSAGLRNVAIGLPLVLHGKDQDRYNWKLTPPMGSAATLLNGATQSPEFTPDIPGIYTVEVTDDVLGEPYRMEIYAGTWRGIITGLDDNGKPEVEALCTACHRDDFAPDMFTPWKETGHAAAFTDGINTNSHFSERCFSCHSVGFDPEVDNGGMDDAPDYAGFAASDILGSTGDNYSRMLDEFPETASFANIQCENCHGPASSDPGMDTLAHGWIPDVDGEPRVSLSADVCATCHGEPARHGRFQQWQLSGHANYELAIEEGESGSCARCHTANGFLAWLPILNGDVAGDPLDDIEVTWTADETHPQTCATCHDPHNAGTVSGIDTDATVRISGTTPPLIAGFQVFGAGRGAICMTCHNSRRGLRNDATFPQAIVDGDISRAPHGSAQTDVLMGENAYFVNVGVRGRHSLLEDTCVGCHMERTPPPDILSYNQGGTNHTFFASKEICSECHTGLTANGLQSVVEAVLHDLEGMIGNAILDEMERQLDLGNGISLGGTPLDDIRDIEDIEISESRGRQAIIVTLDDGTILGPIAMNSVRVVQPAPLEAIELYAVADEGLAKAGWNWALIHNDGSLGAHNPTWTLQVLDAARDALGGSLGGPRAIVPEVYLK